MNFSLADLYDGDQALTTPIAPARPITSPVGSTIPAITPMGPGLIDSVGNIWNEAGQYIGNAANGLENALNPPTPAAAVGGIPNQPSGAVGPQTKQSKGAIASAVALEEWAAGIVSRTSTGTGLSLEDIVFILLGLLLVAAAVFSFKETRTAISNVTDTVTKGAGKAAELAA